MDYFGTHAVSDIYTHSNSRHLAENVPTPNAPGTLDYQLVEIGHDNKEHSMRVIPFLVPMSVMRI